jgi:hypothetical protein
MKTGNGKIANLPSHIRDELNWRINDGDEGKELVEWLNAKPEVIDVVTRLFDGKPISQQNLSQWRTHGYRQWHVHYIIVQEMMALAMNSEDFEETGVDCEKLLMALKANYAEMIQRWIITPTEQMTYRLDVFKDLTSAVLGMRRSEQKDQRFELDRERFEFARETKRGKSPASSEPPVASSPDDRTPRRDAAVAGLSEAGSGPIASEDRQPATSVEPTPPEKAESRDRATLTPSSSPDPTIIGSNAETHDRTPRRDAAVAGLCEAGSGPIASEDRQPTTSVEPMPPAIAESPDRETFIPLPDHPIIHSGLCSPQEAALSDHPPADLPVHPSSAVHDSSADPAQTEEDAPPVIPECPITDDCNPQESPRTAPAEARLSSPSKSRQHRRGHRRRKSRFGQISDPPPVARSIVPAVAASEPIGVGAGGGPGRGEPIGVGAGGGPGRGEPIGVGAEGSGVGAGGGQGETRVGGGPGRRQASHQSVAPTPTPSSQPAATASMPLPRPAVPPSASVIPTKLPTPENVPLRPNRQPGGPPRNASPRNPFGLL